MKPYDKSNSFMRRVTKRVSQLIPGTTWMNMLLGETQSADVDTSACESDDQPPVKKLCTSNNTFSIINNRTCVDTNPSINSPDNHRNSNVITSLPEISAVNCAPSTSTQSGKYLLQTNSSTFIHNNISNRGSLKRKSESIDLSKINKSPKTLAVNFASSTPTLGSVNKQPATTNSLKRSLNSDTVTTSNETLIPSSSKQAKSRENEPQSILKLCETTTKNASSPSFRWDTFVNYGELTERQKLFAQKSPLNCSQVMYGGRSARSNLSKLLGNAPPIHRKTIVPISPSNNSEIRTTSSILLEHISTKDKEIEENKFIIQPKVPLRHKANHKTVPLKIETTVKIDTTPEKNDKTTEKIDKSYNNSSSGFQSRKLKANISKKARGLKSEELEMPVKIDLPNITLTVPVLPNIQLSNTNAEDNEFTFDQPLTLEQFSSQIVEKTSLKKEKKALKKLHTTNSSDKISSPSKFVKPSISVSSCETEKASITNNYEISKNDKVSCIFSNDSKDVPNKCVQTSSSKFESIKPLNVCDNSPQVLKSNPIKELSDDNDKDKNKTNCVEHQTSLPENSQNTFKVKSSTWTCDTCWVPNKNEIDVCVACQTQKPGTTKKVVEQSTWTCDACWVKNKSDCTSCISCGTTKPGSAPENKPKPQFSFGLSNNTFAKSSESQFKFGFGSNNTNQSPPDNFNFVMPTYKNSESEKSFETSTTEFKFGKVNDKADQPVSTFSFGINSDTSPPIKNTTEVSNDHQPLTQFKFGNEGKQDQPDSKFNFGLNATTSIPVAQFKFSSDKTSTDNSVQENLATDSNVITKSTNELKSLVNNTNELTARSVELQSKSNEFKFSDTNQTDKSISSQAIFNFIETNSSNSNSLIKNEDSSKGDKDKIETNSFNSSGVTQAASTTGSTIQLVNGHSHSNETSIENQKSGLIKTSQLFSFGSLAKQDQNSLDDQKRPKTFFGTTINDKPFVAPTLTTSSFTASTVFGSNNKVFGGGPSTSTPTLLSTSVSTPQFSFGLMAPPVSNNFFTTTSKENDKNPQTSSSFTSTTLGGFSFTQSPPVPLFSDSNIGGTIKPVQAEDQINSTPNTIFSQSSTKPPIKLDPNASLSSINFTGGATTQFTAKPETTEQKKPPPQRKILKPVRRIR